MVLKKLLDMRIFANINQNLTEEIVPVGYELVFNLVVGKTKEEELVGGHERQEEDPGLLNLVRPLSRSWGMLIMVRPP